MSKRKGKRFADNNQAKVTTRKKAKPETFDEEFVDDIDELDVYSYKNESVKKDFDKIDDADFEIEYRKKYKNDFLNKYSDLEDEFEKSVKEEENISKKQVKAKDKKKIKTGKKKKKKKRHIFRNIILIVFLLILLGVAYFAYQTKQNGGGVSGALQTLLGHDETTKAQLDTFNCLLLGVSTDLDSTLTDTIMVLSYNPNNQKASILSIPRDTFIGTSRLNATGGDKINAVYSYKRPEGTLECVNKITRLEIEYYAVVKTEALIELVDEIGGVTFNVPINMKYDDPTQNLHINLKAGEQVLDGDKAEQLLRFRHNNDGSSYSSEYGDQDIGRMRTQREFLIETLRQTCTLSNVLKLNKILDVAKRNLETNIDFSVIKDYIPYIVELNSSNIQSASLPGESEYFNNTWFYTYDKSETKDLIKNLFVTRDMTDEQIAEFEETNNVTVVEEDDRTVDDISITIQNGSGSDTKLSQAVAALTAKGYTVKTEKSTTTTTTTTINNRTFVSDDILDDIKSTLGVGNVSNNSSNSTTIDVYIVLGSDYT